jgi:hypothetical protein
VKKALGMVVGVLTTAAVTVFVLWVIRWIGPARRLAGLGGPPAKNPMDEVKGPVAAA